MSIERKLIDILNRAAARRRPNPPSVYGCCCRKNDAGDWQKEDGVEWDDCKDPAWFHPNKECSDVSCGYPSKNIKQPSEMLSVARKQDPPPQQIKGCCCESDGFGGFRKVDGRTASQCPNGAFFEETKCSDPRVDCRWEPPPWEPPAA